MDQVCSQKEKIAKAMYDGARRMEIKSMYSQIMREVATGRLSMEVHTGKEGST